MGKDNHFKHLLPLVVLATSAPTQDCRHHGGHHRHGLPPLSPLLNTTEKPIRLPDVYINDIFRILQPTFRTDPKKYKKSVTYRYKKNEQVLTNPSPL